MYEDDDTEAHAVRWAHRKIMGEWDWVKWHWTEDASFTLCGQPVRVALPNGTFLPDTNDDQRKVTCKHCKRLLEKQKL